MRTRRDEGRQAPALQRERPLRVEPRPSRVKTDRVPASGRQGRAASPSPPPPAPQAPPEQLKYSSHAPNGRCPAQRSACCRPGPARSPPPRTGSAAAPPRLGPSRMIRSHPIAFRAVNPCDRISHSAISVPVRPAWQCTATCPFAASAARRKAATTASGGHGQSSNARAWWTKSRTRPDAGPSRSRPPGVGPGPEPLRAARSLHGSELALAR